METLALGWILFFMSGYFKRIYLTSNIADVVSD